MQRGSLARLAAGPVALAFALGALAVAQGPGRFTTYAGQSDLTATLTLTAGLALVLTGLVTALVRPAGRIGDLAVLAGLAWFAPVWVGWVVWLAALLAVFVTAWYATRLLLCAFFGVSREHGPDGPDWEIGFDDATE